MNDGRWVGQIRSASGMNAFGTFVVIAILWALIPLGIATALAVSRGESVAMAVLLTLVLGWIGLAIVYFGQSKTRAAVEGVAARAASPPPPPAATSPGAGDPESRLERIERLRREDVISDEEYREQRQRILDSI